MKADLVSCLVMLVIVTVAGHCSGASLRVKRRDNPFVTLYANEYHRGEHHIEYLKGGCKNLPLDRDNWASSINTHNRCVDVCDLKDCRGKCVRIYPSRASKIDVGLRLSMKEFNDQATSIKSCYVHIRS